MPPLKFIRQGWRLVTDVPGWPNAPVLVRLRRALPIVLPCAGLILLVAWKYAVFAPHRQSAQERHQPVIALLDEIGALRLDCSDQQAQELAARAKSVAQLTVADAGELGRVLQQLRQAARTKGWDANLQSSESIDEPPAPDAAIAFMQARGRLTPSNGEKSSFSSLLDLLEEFSTNEKRIDLTKLVVRADEQGRHDVELNIRLARLVTHEKTAQ